MKTRETRPRHSLHADVRCVGRGAGDACGYKGGTSGGTCPKCGGMLLSKTARTDAIRLAAQWVKEEEASNAANSNMVMATKYESLVQAITDPENQPSQYGTVLLVPNA